MSNFLKIILLGLLTLIITACGGSGTASPPAPSFAVSPGGIWAEVPSFEVEEVDLPDGFELLLSDDNLLTLDEFEAEDLFLADLRSANVFFISEDGQVIFQSSSIGSIRGTGQITQSDLDGIAGDFQIEAILVEGGFSDEFIFVGDEDFVLPTITQFSGECQATGTLVERTSLSLSLDCTSDDGSQETFDFDLEAALDCSDISCSNSETVYETDFTLADITGTYDRDRGPAAAFGFLNDRSLADTPNDIVELPISIDQIEISPSGNITGLSESSFDTSSIEEPGFIVTNRCDISGEASVIEQGFNLFDVTLSTNCVLFQSDMPDIETAAGDFQMVGLMTVRAFEDRIFLQLLSQLQVDEDSDFPIFVSTSVYGSVSELPQQ